MKFKLENLRSLVKETLSETYFGTSTVGSLASPAFNKVGHSDEYANGIPVDPVDLAEQIRALIGGDAGFPIGDWGDEALNDAARAAADALINTNQKEKIENSVSLYEHKTLLKEAINIVENMEESDSMEQLATAIDRVIKILDSMDMSLDLIYGALSGETGPISGIRLKQRFAGRTMGGGGAPPRAPDEV
tara:strand:- start:143 stop:712 length:570 start_codon:yes stop_codon:yes gene_type:complete